MQPGALVLDTDITRIDGTGRTDPGREALGRTLRPKTRKLGLLALRTPTRTHGSFAHPLEPGQRQAGEAKLPGRVSVR